MLDVPLFPVWGREWDYRKAGVLNMLPLWTTWIVKKREPFGVDMDKSQGGRGGHSHTALSPARCWPLAFCFLWSRVLSKWPFLWLLVLPSAPTTLIGPGALICLSLSVCRPSFCPWASGRYRKRIFEEAEEDQICFSSQFIDDFSTYILYLSNLSSHNRGICILLVCKMVWFRRHWFRPALLIVEMRNHACYHRER